MIRRLALLTILIALAILVSACQFSTPTEIPPPTQSPPLTLTALPTSVSTIVPSLTPSPTPVPTLDLVALLRANPMPENDPVALASSMRPVSESLPKLVADPSAPRAVGDQRAFWLANVDQASYTSITATLRVQLEHIEMWAQDDIAVDQDALQRSASAFEEHIYPAVRTAFGSEWSPGIDGDPHLLVLNGSFSGAAGYFASANEFVREVNPYSNQAEMFVMNLAALNPGSEAYDSILAHEFQHMIHWYQDRNESSWVNEGASQLAEEIVGYGPPEGHIWSFAQQPDLQLTTWSDQPGQVSGHYGAAYLFLRYLRDRLGHDVLRQLIAEPADGMLGLERTLDQIEDAPTPESLFADWLVANGLDADEIDPRYGYAGFELTIEPTVLPEALPTTIADTVSPFGADYFALPLSADRAFSLTFEGQTEVALVPNEPTGGSFEWWSNRGDSGHSALQRRFDLSQVTTATLTYDLWHDIEPGWDFAHLRISTDGGQSWELLRAPGMTDHNPVGNALGWGYTGASGHDADERDVMPVWIHETVDLGAYIGQKVELRFDYLTDDAVTYAGLCLDNIAIDALDFYDDAETDKAGWTSQGFIRHDNILPQRYLVRWVEANPTGIEVQDLLVDAQGRGTWTITPAHDAEHSLLIIAGFAPGTTLPTSYTLSVEHLP